MDFILTQEQEVIITGKMFKIEAAGNLLTWLTPDDIYEGVFKNFYQNLGAIVKQEAEEIREMMGDLDKLKDSESEITKLKALS